MSRTKASLLLILVFMARGTSFLLAVLTKTLPKAKTMMCAVLTVVNPLTASVLGILVADERLTVLKLIGYVIIMSALLIYNAPLCRRFSFI